MRAPCGIRDDLERQLQKSVTEDEAAGILGAALPREAVWLLDDLSAAAG